MPDQTVEQLMQAISERMAAISDQTSEANIRRIVADSLPALANDREFVRKMRFGARADPALLGTKYYRWGLSLADVEWLFDLQTSLTGQARIGKPGQFYGGPSETLRNTFAALSEAAYMSEAQVRAMDVRQLDEEFGRIPLAMFPESDRALVKRGAWRETSLYQRANDAMDTAETGFGLQLIGAQYVGDLWQAARYESTVFNLLDSFEMTAPTVYLPVEVDIPELLFAAESTASNASDYTSVSTGSNRVSVTAKKFIIFQVWSGEMEEDSIIPFVPFLRRQQQFSLGYYSDSLVLNGDDTNAATGNINSDDADPADTKHYLAFDGIRHGAIVDATAQKSDVAGATTFAKLIKMRQRMKDTSTQINVHWGKPTNPDDLVYVAEDATADAIALLDEVVTVENYGANATVLNGEIARIGRNRLLTSLALPLTDTDGKYTTTSPATNDTKGQVLAFNLRAYKVGWRRRVRTETMRKIGTDQTEIATSLRMGFGRFTATGAASGIKSVALDYDITV